MDKYDVQTPRYTSYPAVPHWNTGAFSRKDWEQYVYQSTMLDRRLAMYIHLPFCESLCTFCGCHKHLTRQHSNEAPYLDLLAEEWGHWRAQLALRPALQELHLGGGTPTFFAPERLHKFLSALLSQVNPEPDALLGFEGHPNNTTEAHLEALADLGFKRVSFGVQDYAPHVQQAIHRIQPLERVQEVTRLARKHGYTSVSHDLVYGLPKQRLCDIRKTVEHTLTMMPDRISLYSYAHVPWVKGTGQRGFDERDLPQKSTKRALYDQAAGLLEQAGYVPVGMDHFALPHDALAQAKHTGQLHRNFMGYTTATAPNLVGLGMSAISDFTHGFAQNAKSLKEYREKVLQTGSAVVKGHLNSAEDRSRASSIRTLMCQERLQVFGGQTALPADVRAALAALEQDGLVAWEGESLQITPAGVPFVRNVAACFDAYLHQTAERAFSRSV